ncbi:hypothetical protein [Mycolicibacterium gadium]|uniref:Uncharacterized protein n=1 Tax=Mycolicibacterium gadium TaxID=1794 RepID=A0ABT6GZQ0_MYCGU|nr:hypothetical protein [Mycolicibacterium gadium]MDG5486702.1 hypothetical protein [Mycolicibacterium gadium]
MIAIDGDNSRDVVFTPFMLHVREALTNAGTAAVDLQLLPSDVVGIAVAVDEWFGLRARAEHVLCEANGMLPAEMERIALEDEYGTGELAFVIRWRGQATRLLVHSSEPHTGQLLTASRGAAQPVKPADQGFLEDLVIEMVRAGAAEPID